MNPKPFGIFLKIIGISYLVLALCQARFTTFSMSMMILNVLLGCFMGMFGDLVLIAVSRKHQKNKDRGKKRKDLSRR